MSETRRFLHGRRLAPLIKVWVACLIVAALIFYFETMMPAFHEVVKIVYFVIAVILVIATARALRTREGNRRTGERRHADRRDENEGN
jgi:small-conductance mechanosensitive channel